MAFKVVLLLFSVLLLTSLAQGQEEEPIETQEHFIDPDVTLVETWDGWGTSLAWWADQLGGMESQEVIDTVLDAMFNENKLNFNIVRYVIGGTTPASVVPYKCGDYRPGAATESYRDGPDQDYNWTRDATQRSILTKAIASGANILEAFSNSPPQWMTISGCAKGNADLFPLHQNLDPANATLFARYVADVLVHFRNEWNITFDYYAPFNEPLGLEGIGSWAAESTSQEGCHMNRATQLAVLQSVAQEFTTSEIFPGTKITASDETQINTAVNTAKYLVANGVSDIISKWNVHGYWDVPRFLSNRRDVLNIIADNGGQKLWMDEMGWPSTSAEDMTQAFDVCRRILSDLRNMWPSAWVYWQAMESIDEWGIISLPYKTDAKVEEIQYNSGYWGMMQFSKYVKQGYKLIHTNDPDAVTAYDQQTKTLVIVIVHENNSTRVHKTFDLRRFSRTSFPSLALVSATRSSDSERNSDIRSEVMLEIAGSLGAALRLEIPPESISTIVISGVEHEASKNLLKNGDFEDDNDTTSWILSGGNQDLNSSSSFPWRGLRHGYLPQGIWGQEVKLSQEVKVVAGTEPGVNTRRLYLTLMASTTGQGVIVQAHSSNSLLARAFVNSWASYRLYSLAFSARVGETVIISVKSIEGGGPTHIDNAVLYEVPEFVGLTAGAAPMMARLSLATTLSMILVLIINIL